MVPSLRVSLIALMLVQAGSARAVCDAIAGTQRTFRGALATVDRPYARPGDTLDPANRSGLPRGLPRVMGAGSHDLDGNLGSDGRDFALARYLPDGRQDPTFGGQCVWEDGPLTRPLR